MAEKLSTDSKLSAAGETLRLFDEAIEQNYNAPEELETKLAASFPLSNEKLEAIRRKYQPSPIWYRHDEKPF